MEKQLLTNLDIFPSKDVLQDALGNVYEIYEELENLLTQNEFALTYIWHYYKDSKAWLCKVAYKKKTIFWLSIWEGFFKLSFFFLPRHLEGIKALKMDKSNFETKDEWGKMIPFFFNVNSKQPFNDLYKLIQYKKGAK